MPPSKSSNGSRSRRAETAKPRGRAWSRIGEVRNLGLVGVLVVLTTIGGISQPDSFLTRSNLITVLTQASVIGVITVGMTFVIIGGGIDLSVGSLMGLASVWATTTATQSMGTWAVIGVALLVGVGFGTDQRRAHRVRRAGAVHRHPRDAGHCGRSCAEHLEQADPDPQLRRYQQVGNQQDPRRAALVWMFAAVAVIGWVVLNRTTYGRRTLALGGNPEAARLAGLNTRIHTVSLYALSGLCAGIGAIMIASQTTSGSSTNGDGYELNAIAAVIIGGTLLAGGAGTLVGSVLGVLVFTTISNLLIQNNLQTEVQNIVTGVIIVLAVLLQRRSKEVRS